MAKVEAVFLVVFAVFLWCLGADLGGDTRGIRAEKTGLGAMVVLQGRR